MRAARLYYPHYTPKPAFNSSRLFHNNFLFMYTVSSMQKGTPAFSGLKEILLLGALCLFSSCGFPAREVHIHDRHDYAYNIIKDFTASSAPALVLIDYQYDAWIDALLLEGVISAVYWVAGSSPTPLNTAKQIGEKIQIMDIQQIEQTKLPENCIVSIDLAVLAHEQKAPSGEFLQRMIKWINAYKPRLITVALSGAYQYNTGDMYSFLTEIMQGLPSRTAVYMESETTIRQANSWELYRRQNWHIPVSQDTLFDPNIWPDPWIWYALPEKCVELFKKKNAVVKGENRDDITAVWNDPAYKKLRELYGADKLREILQSARQSIFRVWNDEEMPALPPLGTNEGLAVRLLVQGKDRGCLSWYKNSGDIMLFAEYCAAEALRDPRYETVRADEAGNTLLELTIFGEWEDMSNPLEFIPGYHNLWLADGVHNTILQASLVPQRQYTKEAFLENICVKAGLEKDAWKENKNFIWRRSPGLWYIEQL